MTLSPFICSDSGDRRERSVCEAGEGAAGVTCAELKRISKIKAFPKPDKPVCIWSFATLGLQPLSVRHNTLKEPLVLQYRKNKHKIKHSTGYTSFVRGFSLFWSILWRGLCDRSGANNQATFIVNEINLKTNKLADGCIFLSLNKKYSQLLLLPVTPSRVGAGLNTVLSHSFQLAPGVARLCHFCLEVSSPGACWAAPPSLALRVPPEPAW